MNNCFGEFCLKNRIISHLDYLQKIRYSFSYLSSIESGQRQAPRYETLQKMVEILELTEIERLRCSDKQ